MLSKENCLSEFGEIKEFINVDMGGILKGSCDELRSLISSMDRNISERTLITILVGHTLDNFILESFLDYYCRGESEKTIKKYIRDILSQTNIGFHNHTFIELFNMSLYSGLAYLRIEEFGEFIYDNMFYEVRKIFRRILEYTDNHFVENSDINLPELNKKICGDIELREDIIKVNKYFLSELGFKCPEKRYEEAPFIELFNLMKIIINQVIVNSLLESDTCLSGDISKFEDIKLAFRDLICEGYKIFIDKDEMNYSYIRNIDEYKTTLLRNAENVCKETFKKFRKSIVFTDDKYEKINKILNSVKEENYKYYLRDIEVLELIEFILLSITVYIIYSFRDHNKNMIGVVE